MSTLSDLEEMKNSLIQLYKDKFELLQIIPSLSFSSKEEVGCTTQPDLNLGKQQEDLQTFETCKFIAANSGLNKESYFSLVESSAKDTESGLFKCYISDVNPKLKDEFNNANPIPTKFEAYIEEINEVVLLGNEGCTSIMLDENGDVGLYNASKILVKTIFRNGNRYSCNEYLSKDDAFQYQTKKDSEINNKFPLPEKTISNELTEYQRINRYWKTVGCPAGDKPVSTYRLIFGVREKDGEIALRVQQTSSKHKKGWKTVADSTGKNYVAKMKIPFNAVENYKYALQNENMNTVPVSREISKINPLISNDNRFSIYVNEKGSVEIKYFIKSCSKKQNGYTYTNNENTAFIYKTNSNPDSNKLFYNNKNNNNPYLQFVPFTNENIQLSSSYTNLGSYAPPAEISKNSVDVTNEKECLNVCTSNDNCGYVYYYGPINGNTKCAIGEVSKNAFIPLNKIRPLQLEKDILTSSLYVRNRQVNQNVLEKEETVNPIVLDTIDKYNQYSSFNKVYTDMKTAFGLKGENPFVELMDKFKLIYEGPNKISADESQTKGDHPNEQQTKNTNPVPITDIKPVIKNNSITEGFDSQYCSTLTGQTSSCKDFIINSKLNPLKDELTAYTSKQYKVRDNSIAIDKKIEKLNDKKTRMKTLKNGEEINNKYEFLGIWQEDKTLDAGLKEDNKMLMESQANVMVLSTIACVSMIITAIMVSSS